MLLFAFASAALEAAFNQGFLKRFGQLQAETEAEVAKKQQL